MNERILFVDDEPKILEAYRRTLRKSFTVVPAESGRQALKLMASEGPFPVVVSDMQMPEMNGVQLLSEIKIKYPDTVRLMLTGNADQKTAVEAINTSDVYRFLNKPCPPDEMTMALNAALRHFQLAKAEQVLLENTVKGSIKALVEVLSIVSPKIFGRAAIIRGYVIKCAKKLNVENTWELEATALLSQIGIVTLPEAMLARALKGNPISEEERLVYDKHPEISANLIDRIPRLENISRSVRYQNNSYDGSGTPIDSVVGPDLPLGARILKAVLDLVAGEASGLTSEEALGRLKSRKEHYDPEVLETIAAIIGDTSETIIKEITISQLTEGMKIASDVLTFSGALLVSKGQEVGPSLVARLINFWRNDEIPEKVNVLVSVDEP